MQANGELVFTERVRVGPAATNPSKTAIEAKAWPVNILGIS